MEEIGVAPYTGAWIETPKSVCKDSSCCVAPYTGAWIETPALAEFITRLDKSHPIRVRGLKPYTLFNFYVKFGRTLYGCVD